MRIARRPAADSDRDFLFSLYASTRAAELAMVPWNDQQKRAFLEHQFEAQSRGYRESYPDASHQILLVDHAPVGRLYLSRQPERLHILDITVAPDARNSGIGSHVLRELLQEARDAAKPVTIYLESFNPSLRLFERLGFAVASEDGFLLLMRGPVSGSAPESAGPSAAAKADG